MTTTTVTDTTTDIPAEQSSEAFTTFWKREKPEGEGLGFNDEGTVEDESGRPTKKFRLPWT